LRDFGVALGTAYQIYDDCLDLFGSEAAAGKSLGTDLAKGKLTLPVLRFWRRAGAGEKERMQKLVQNWEPRSLRTVLELLRKHETLAESIIVIHQYLRQARQALEGLPDTANLAGLTGLTEYLARQTDNLGICV
jgi:octaprenyl-diphosphate synthase